MENYNFDFVPKGWQCPVCGRVYSPDTPMCIFCVGRETNVITCTETDSEPIRKMMVNGIPFEDLRYSKTI